MDNFFCFNSLTGHMGCIGRMGQYKECLWMMNSLKAWYRRERDKIRGLETFQKKVEYIWQYYYLWIIGIAFAVFMTGYMVYHYTTAIKENWFFITFTNTNADVGDHSDLWEGYVEYTGYDTTVKNVEFNNISYFDYAKGNAAGNEYYEMFVAHVEAGTLDAVTMGKESLEALGSTGRLMDLNDERCASIMEKYGDRLVYCEPADEDYGSDQVPVGIDVSDSILMSEYEIYSESCVLGIGSYAQHLDAVEEFLDYIFEEAE